MHERAYTCLTTSTSLLPVSTLAECIVGTQKGERVDDTLCWNQHAERQSMLVANNTLPWPYTMTTRGRAYSICRWPYMARVTVEADNLAITYFELTVDRGDRITPRLPCGSAVGLSGRRSRF
ncbi:hypothetical protein C8Q80DRAFT_1189110, partial [Daedaleopsis nitida]